jgi:hypothetical protein
MRAVWWILPMTAPLVLAAGCGAASEPAPALRGLLPERAYNDAAVVLALLGGPFRPPVRVDTGNGTAKLGDAHFGVFLEPADPAVADPRPVPALSSAWIASAELDAVLGAGLASGAYQVGVRDPRGQTFVFDHLFTSLGPDLDAPVLTILQPSRGAAVGAGTVVEVDAELDDRPGLLHAAGWSVSSNTLGTLQGPCALDGQPGDAPCTFSFVAPLSTALVESIAIGFWAEDTVGNRSSASTEIEVALAPAISMAVPNQVTTATPSAIVVLGNRFVPGLSQIFIDGSPLPADPDHGPDTDQVLHGLAQPHIAGTVLLTVSTGTSASGSLPFTFVAPPKLRMISPAFGPEAGGTAVTVVGNNFRQDETEIQIDQGAGPISAGPLTFVSGSRLTFTMPARPPTGASTVSIIAADPISGTSELPDVFTYTPTPTP